MPKAHPKLYDKKWLTEQYLTKQRTLESIGQDIGVTKHSIKRALKRHDIVAREHTSKYPQLNDKQWLKEMYVDELLSTKQIADLIGGNVGGVASALISMGIKLRSVKEGWAARFPTGRYGEESSNWRGGITPEHLRIRASKEYAIWRKSIFERDNYTCRFCSKHGGDLEADHIKPFAYFPELRLALDNGRTLCKPCHKKTETYRRPKKEGDPAFGIQ